MKCSSSVFLVLAAALAAHANTGKISGSVVDQNGAPVPRMTVEVYSLDMGSSGGTPQTQTDDQGHFAIEVVAPFTSEGRAYGRRWAVSPFREKGDYYPHLMPFYQTDQSQPQGVELTPQAPEAIIQVKLGPKAGALKGRVTDAVTGHVLNPYFEFAWASDPGKKMGKRTTEDYRILLPSGTDIKMTVSLEGYKKWSYPGVINIGPGQDITLEIKLEPEAKEK